MIKRLSALLIVICTGLLPLKALAQGSIPVFTWRSHISYNNVIDLAKADELIYAASPNGLFFLDLTEGSVNRLTKNNGLSDVSIGAIGYSEADKILAVGYANGNIDLLSENGITNIKTVLEASSTQNKTFRSITFQAGKAYFNGGLGTVVLDLALGEVIESYQNIGPNGDALAVSEILFAQDSLYAATEDGILSTSMLGGNRQDFNNWKRAFTGIDFENIEAVNGTLYASAGADIFINQNNEWTFLTSASQEIRDLSQQNNNLLLLTSEGVFQLEEEELSSLHQFENQAVLRNKILLTNEAIWIGDGMQGLLKISGSSEQSYKPSGPFSDENWLLNKQNDAVVKIAGGYSESISPLNLNAAVSFFIPSEGWSSFELKSNGTAIMDFTDAEFTGENENPSLLLSSFQNGLYQFSDGSFSSVPIQNLTGNLKLTGMALENQSLWLTNYGATNSLYQWNIADNIWQNYTLGNSRAKYALDVFVAPNADKWLAVDPNQGGGIVVFNETSDSERYLNTNGGQGGLPGNYITSMVTDQNLFIWVGTNEGIAFFPNPDAILKGQSITASIPIYENRLLLREEYITSIAIDAANRKWFGTNNNGVWLFSETGEELVHHFTVQNSPLPSNKITSLLVDNKTGEVFMGTDQGLVSFRSDATEGSFAHQNVEIYPNPVTKDFNNAVVIQGLANNAKLKITDVSGKLVREAQAFGSTATWNGRDYNGQRVSTGIYLVFSSNADGTQTFVGKIAVI